MIPKRYSSFDEIDQDLKILKLQQQIDRENLKLKFRETKSSLYPTSLLGGLGGLIQKFFISLFAKKVLNKFNK